MNCEEQAAIIKVGITDPVDSKNKASTDLRSGITDLKVLYQNGVRWLGLKLDVVFNGRS